MQVQIVDNGARTMVSVLTRSLGQAEEIRIAVAFASRRGLDLLRPALEKALSAGATAEFLVGMDMHITEPDALHQLYQVHRSKDQAATTILTRYGIDSAYR